MARHFVLGSWANADEFDYSGEQLMGSRQGKSICMDHMLPNGMANLKRYGDPVEQQKKAKPKPSVADKIDLAERHFQRVEQLSIDLDAEYYSGEIDDERYEMLRYKMDERLIRAFRRLEKENAPIWQKEDREFEEKSLHFSLDDVIYNQTGETSKKSGRKSLFSRVKSADKSLIKGNGCGSMALRNCSNNNVFLIGFCTIMNVVNKLKEGF